jgi:hypothetical protein
MLEKQIDQAEHMHTIAKMFAAGMTPKTVRRNTGLSMHRLTVMWKDPTFQELLANYRDFYNEKLDELVDHYRELSVGDVIEGQIIEGEK